MMPLQIFSARNFAVGNLATVFLYAAVSLGMLLVALFLQETAGLSATEAGLATLPIPVLSFFLARWFGTLAGRHGPRLYMALGPLVAAAGYLLMTSVAEPFDIWTQMLPGLVVFGLGLSMTVSPLTAAILAAVDPAQSGIGSAINNAISRIAGLIAIALTGVIIGGSMDFGGFRRRSIRGCRAVRGGGPDLMGGHSQRRRRLQPGLCEGCGGMSRPGDAAPRVLTTVTASGSADAAESRAARPRPR